jgi:hypothetical protein
MVVSALKRKWDSSALEAVEFRSAFLRFEQAQPQLTLHPIAHPLYAHIEQAPTNQNGRPLVKKAEFNGSDKDNFFFQGENVVKKKKESGLQDSNAQADTGYDRDYCAISGLLS